MNDEYKIAISQLIIAVAQYCKKCIDSGRTNEARLTIIGIGEIRFKPL